MIPAPAAADIAHTIQQAVAPVFLLTGIGAILNILASRLVRSVDRARAIEAKFAALGEEEHERAVWELRLIDRRMAVANLAVLLCATAAMLVCVVVAGLFVFQLIGAGFGSAMALLFIAAMALLIAGLALFLVEIRLAVRQTRIRVELLEHEDPGRHRRWL